MSATIQAPRVLRTTRPLYLKQIPIDVWERVHINAIKSQMRLQEYIVELLANAHPLVPAAPADGQSPEDQTAQAIT